MDLELRSRRRQEAARSFRWRLGLSIVLALLLHLAWVPALWGVFRFEGADQEVEAPVEWVRVPASQWDAGRAQAAASGPQRQAPKERPEREQEKEKAAEKAPGQVVEVAPGNQEEAPDARFAAESSNRAERETIARDRAAGAPVTMPKPTVPEVAQEEAGREGGDALARGEVAEPEEAAGKGQGKETVLEIPSVERQDALDAPKGSDGPGGIRAKEATPGVEGNSDRFRVEVGGGDGEAEGGGPGGGPPGGLKLFPSGAVVDRIVGGPAPDHVEGVEEGAGTFLNTKEWKHASFFNRVKKSVSLTWDPVAALRVRDPTGNVYAWKDRNTQLSVALRADGSIADLWVERSSGVDFLDREAMAAFERAQPFPHPPSALVDESGLIRFSFGFYLQTGESFRIFRRF